MKTSSDLVLILSVVGGVLLWAIATFFEDDRRWVPDELLQEPQVAEPRIADTPVRTQVPRSCDSAEARLVESVNEAQACNVDSDCTLFDYGYPMQCLTSVANRHITALRYAYREYERSCSHRVFYDCPTGNMERRPVCRNNSCAVDLVSIDPLQDETKEYLGIGQR